MRQLSPVVLLALGALSLCVPASAAIQFDTQYLARIDVDGGSNVITVFPGVPSLHNPSMLGTNGTTANVVYEFAAPRVRFDFSASTPASTLAIGILPVASENGYFTFRADVDTTYTLTSTWTQTGGSAQHPMFVNQFQHQVRLRDDTTNTFVVNYDKTEPTGGHTSSLPAPMQQGTLIAGHWYTLSYICQITAGNWPNANFQSAPSSGSGFLELQFAPPPPCAGDANGDNTIDFDDVTSVIANWGANYSPGSGPGDANHDGVVTFDDITAVLAAWGQPC